MTNQAHGHIEKPGQRIYLDAATATPLHPAAQQALSAALADGWADPVRLYTEAGRARQLLDAARSVFAEILQLAPENIVFCASGTQAAHAAVLGTLSTARNVFIHSAIEHSAVLHAAQWHEHNGGAVRSIPVDRHGVVDVTQFVAAATQPSVGLAALMSANHEVGTKQPITEVAAACTQAGVPLYVDASVSLGWTDLPTGWSLLSASARKWGGPAGVGILAITPGVRWRSPWPVDERENGRGIGAVNVPAVVAAAAALRARFTEQRTQEARLFTLVDKIRHRIPELISDVEVVGHPTERVPHIVTFSCLYVDGETLVRELDTHGFAVSSGSACTSSTLEPSHVLAAMGVLTHGNLRLSLHPSITEGDIDQFLAVLPGIVARLRSIVA